MANLLEIAQQTTKKVTFPKIKETDKAADIVRRFCTYYANIRRYQCQELLSQEVGALAVEVFGQDNVYTAYKVKDIMGDIETIGYDQAHFSNKLKRLFEGMSLRDEENHEHLFGEQILLTLHGSRLPATKSAEDTKRTLYLLIVDDSKVRVPLKKNLSFWRESSSQTRYGLVSFSFLELMSIHSEGIYKECSYYGNIQKIANVLKREYEDALAANLNAQYVNQSTKTIASVREDKIFQDYEMNSNTSFLDLGFSKVEVDTERYRGSDFDKEKFRVLENEWEKLCNHLPHSTVEPELKFRKLGKHKASGLYVPGLNIMAVDVRDSSSFIHEYGHYLDYTYDQSGIISSTSHSFKDIRNIYKASLLKLIQIAEETRLDLAQAVHIKKKLDYYLTPTEVFARGFEWWVFETYTKDSELLSDEATYYSRLEYRALRQCRHLLFAFFDTFFENYRAMQPIYKVEKEPKTLVACRKPLEDKPTTEGKQLSLFEF